MHVTETVEYTTVVESKRKMTYGELERETEDRRVRGRLDDAGVSDVRMFLEEAREPEAKTMGGKPHRR